MPENHLSHFTREELEAEICQLRAKARHSGGDSARAKAVFDSAIEFAIVVTDTAGIITDWNAGAEQVMGWTAEEMRGQDASRFFVPEDRAEGRAEYEMRCSLKEGRATDERWHLRKGEERFWASGEMMPLRDEQGLHIGFVKIFRDRTAEHLAGKALKETERLLRRAQEAGGVGLFHVDLANDVLYGTPEFFRLYGLTPAASYPAGEVQALIIAEDASLVSTAAGRAQGEYIANVDYRIQRPDTGEVRWINRTGLMETDSQGKPVRFSGTARDITSQREADEARTTSDARYRVLFEAIDDGFCVIEFFDGPHGPLSDYRHVEANLGYERQTGIANILGQTIRELEPGDADEWVALYGKVLETGQPVRFERYFVAAGRDIEVSASRIEPASRHQVSILFRDITGRKAAEALARENIERVQLALSAGAIIGTWVWDIQNDLFSVDESFAATFDLDPALGRKGFHLDQVIETVHPADKEGLLAAIHEAVARGGHFVYQYRTRRADGQYYWLEASGQVRLSADGVPSTFPGVLIDLEGRRAVEGERDNAIAALRALTDSLEQRVAERTEELMRSEDQLRQSQKMEAVGQLTGGLAHDFNNLLAGILGSLELMSKRFNQGRLKDIDKYMTAAQGAAKRAAALTHRLLAFSRRQTLDPVSTDVNALVSDMRDLVQRTVGPGVPVQVLEAPDLWTVQVDQSQLENALLNLCINARDAMPDGGSIIVETSNRHIDRKAAQRQDIPEGEYLCLSVSDTGTGMPPDVVAKAFDPFFTTKPLGQGTGLGLSMIYGFAKQSHGQVRIHSIVGEGTTVSIYLPRHLGSASPSELSPSTELSIQALEGQTILVVEDEPTVRLLVTDVLAELGYTAIEAADSAGGLGILVSDARIDLLISDVGLPGGMNGRQMADAARAKRPELKVLFITGYAENAMLKSGELDVGMSVMTKPFAVDTLAARISELLGR